MSWLSNTMDKLSGKSMKEDLGALGNRWEDAYGESGKVQDELLARGRDALDPYSQQNLMQKGMMADDSADNMAEAMRLQGRNAKMQGGAPIGVMAQQGIAGAQKNEASNLKAFNQYLQGQQQQGTGLMSGAAANMAELQGNKFNLMESQRAANKQIDANATKWGVNMVSQGARMAMGDPSVYMGMAEGGWVPESYDANDSSQKLNIDGQKSPALINMRNSLLMKSLSTGRSGGANAELYDAMSPEAKMQMKQDLLNKAADNVNAPAMDDYDAPNFPEESEPDPGGMLQTIMGPKGPMQIGTRMGGELIGAQDGGYIPEYAVGGLIGRAVGRAAKKASNYVYKKYIKKGKSKPRGKSPENTAKDADQAKRMQEYVNKEGGPDWVHYVDSSGKRQAAMKGR